MADRRGEPGRALVDFGTSLVTNQKVLTEFAALFPATIELGLAGMLIAVLVGVPAGAIAAVKRGTWYDQLLMGVSVTGYSMPIFSNAALNSAS